MAVEIRVPPLGESIIDAVIATWHKQIGDAVQQGDVLVELETDKINIDVSAEQSGVLQQVLKQQGEVVAVGDVLGVIAAISGPLSTQRTASGPLSAQRTTSGPLPTQAATERPPSVLARKIAAEYNVDLSQVKGGSSHRRVTKNDVISYLEENMQKTSARSGGNGVEVQDSGGHPSVIQESVPFTGQLQGDGTSQRGREERVQLSRRRQTIAQRLLEAQHTAAILTTFNEIDMGAVMEVRSRRKESFKERHNVALGFMSFFTKAVVGALKAFPRLNAEMQGNEMVLKQYYDIGIAVGAAEGLVVPVLRDADRKSFAEIEREIAELAQRARENTLSLATLQGGTFTITNGGVFGSLLSTPILNTPQVGILGMHKIEQRPVAIDNQVVIRPMMYVALSYDHRLVDGREAVQFLVRVKELVEDPAALLLEG